MTSEDGKVFILHVKQDSGEDLMLGFPHDEISNIVENAVMQAGRGKHASGRLMQAALNTTSFELGRGPDGEAVLSFKVGQNGEISFLLPADMPGHLSQALQWLAN